MTDISQFQGGGESPRPTGPRHERSDAEDNMVGTLSLSPRMAKLMARGLELLSVDPDLSAIELEDVAAGVRELFYLVELVELNRRRGR